MQQVFERLVAANIQVLPISISPRHVVFERDGCVALVESNPHGFGNIGSAGVLTECGFATLIWRGNDAFFVGKGYERAAPPDAVQQLRSFQADLEKALRPAVL